MSYVKERAVEWAKTQVGFHEGRNNQNPYSLWQYGNAFNPWCASFQCKAQYEGGYRFVNCTYGEKGEAYTPTEAQRAREQGTWRDRWWRSQPGDAVLFDWANNGLIDHVELVVYDDGNRIVTIGGNTSDSVAYRTRDRAYVAGFWALSQDKQAQPVLDPSVIEALKQLHKWQKEVTKQPLERGETSNNVTILHQLLVAKGLLGKIPKKSNTYGLGTALAVAHGKRIGKLEGGGGKAGGTFAAWLLNRR